MKKTTKKASYKILSIDPLLKPYESDIELRMKRHADTRQRLLGDKADLVSFANGYLYYGFHRTEDGWVFREWAPGADGRDRRLQEAYRDAESDSQYVARGYSDRRNRRCARQNCRSGSGTKGRKRDCNRARARYGRPVARIIARIAAGWIVRIRVRTV